MEGEIDMALSEFEINAMNYMKLINIIINGFEVNWFPIICNICRKPPLHHTEVDGVCTETIKLLRGYHTEYKTLMKAHKSIQTNVEEIVARLHLTIPHSKALEESWFPL